MLTSLAALLTAAVTAACQNPQFIPSDGAVRVVDTEVSVAGGNLTAQPAYTSNLPFAGQFGRGFGIQEEMRIEPLASGAYRVTVPGPCPACGSAVPETSPEGLLASAAAAAQTLRTSGASRLAGEASDYAAALASDRRYLQGEWEARRDAGLQAARSGPSAILDHLPAAARYRVVPLPSGYLRFADAIQVQELDAHGRLERVVNAAGLVKRLLRDADGRITRIEDGRGHSISFEVDAAGHTVRAIGSGGVTATYGYDGEGHLRWSQGRDGRTDYTWGPDDRLLEVKDMRRTARMTYEPRWAGGRVTSLVEDGEGGERFEYQGQPGGFSRAVTVFAIEPEPSEVIVGPQTAGPRELRRYTFVEPLTVDGRRWTWQETVEEDDRITAKTYDDRTFQPLIIADGGRVAGFEYDALGRLLRKEVEGAVTVLTYGPAGKVATVTQRDAEPGAAWVRTSYAYDAAAHLILTQRDGATCKISYDALGRISTIDTAKDGASTRLAFTYNELDKPIRIQAEGVGGITVSYRPDGEIEKVDSEGGRTIALQVTSTFQQLMELIRPADVKLSAW